MVFAQMYSCRLGIDAMERVQERISRVSSIRANDLTVIRLSFQNKSSATTGNGIRGIKIAKTSVFVTRSSSTTPLETFSAQGEEPFKASRKEPKLEVKNLTKVASQSRESIISNINFSVEMGAICSLIGPSGSGKSTVLRSINRLWEPPRGAVFLDGVDVADMEVTKLRTKVGMVFQSAYLFEGTVAQNVRFGPSLRKQLLSDEEVDALLTKSGIDCSNNNFREKYVTELSGGESQRVSIARTLANNPEILLLDEPTSSLDPTSTKKVEETILQLRDNTNLTIVLVSHSMDQVLRVSDKIVLLNKGEVVDSGTPEEIKQSDRPEVELFFSGDLP